MNKKMLSLLLSVTALSAPLVPATAETTVLPPKLIVAISVDQLSADLFAQYRGQFSRGFMRLQQGAVFPSTYHAHAATETCPGHATILTGASPARHGVVANVWMDLSIKRADKKIYCSEDASIAGTSSDNYVVSPVHLKVPTLGDRMKAVDLRSRVFSVSGKDRGAVMMGGHAIDQAWWWGSRGFVTYADRKAPPPPAIAKANASVAAILASGLPAMALPEFCEPRARKFELRGSGRATVGGTIPALPVGSASLFRSRPESDEMALEIAADLMDAEKLGSGPAPDLLAISLSATDYVGHRYGPGGGEMCTQMLALDAALGRFFERLDARGVPYAIMLTADHGGHDIPERNRELGFADAARIDPDFTVEALNAALGHAKAPVFFAEAMGGDLYVAPSIRGKARAKLIQDAKAWLERQPQVEVALTAEEILRAPQPTVPPELWTLPQRAAASYMPGRSGDLLVVLKPRVTPIADPTKSYVATHGSIWDYDRRVPTLYWWPGIAGFEQPNSALTVDIMPTLAALIDLPVKPAEIDGKCRDLDAGPESTCD